MTPQDTTFWETRPANHDHMDWPYTENDWIKGYEESVKHPHRDEIIEILEMLPPFDSLLEVGCSVGPNLKRIGHEFPTVKLRGIDPNEDSVEKAKTFVPDTVKVGDVRELSTTQRYDVVLADAALMYITPDEIRDVMDRIALAATKAVIIVDRYSKSWLGEVTGGVWGRDYEHLLKERGFLVEKRKMTENSWPTSPNWIKYGHYFIGTKA